MVNRFKKFKIKNGFTLVEIMIVVAIIALLAAIAIPNYTRHMQRARATEAVATMSMVRQAMRDYFINNSTHFNITGLPTTNLGNVDNLLPASVATGVPTPADAGVDIDIGGQFRIAQYFSSATFTVAAAVAAGFDTDGASNLFINPPAIDFIIFVNGSVNPTCGATDCAINASSVVDYRLEMDNTGRVFVSYDTGMNWDSY